MRSTRACSSVPCIGVLQMSGFAASRNRKSEEERSPEGLEEAEKKRAHPEKPLQQKRKQAKDFCCFEEQSSWQEQQAQTGRLVSAHPPENLKDRCLLRFFASHMTHLSYLLFRLPVPTSRKPQICPKICDKVFYVCPSYRTSVSRRELSKARPGLNVLRSMVA